MRTLNLPNDLMPGRNNQRPLPNGDTVTTEVVFATDLAPGDAVWTPGFTADFNRVVTVRAVNLFGDDVEVTFSDGGESFGNQSGACPFTVDRLLAPVAC